jgi:Bacterial tandem repeat domain 1
MTTARISRSTGQIPRYCKSAISTGPVKIGVAANQLETAWRSTGGHTGWFGIGFQPDAAEDHCVSLSGYGSIAWLAQQLGVQVPAGINGTKLGYALFTWDSIGIIDEPSMRAITCEAWLRQPTTVLKVESAFSGVWRAGSDAYYLWANVNWDNFRAKWEELSKQNLRLVDVESYTLGGQRVWAGVWRAGSDAHYLWVNASWDDFRAKWEQLAKQNLRLTVLTTYEEGGTRRYAGVWRAGSDAYYLWANTNWDNFRAKWEELGKQNLRLIHLETFESGTTALAGGSDSAEISAGTSDGGSDAGQVGVGEGGGSSSDAGQVGVGEGGDGGDAGQAGVGEGGGGSSDAGQVGVGEGGGGSSDAGQVGVGEGGGGSSDAGQVGVGEGGGTY